MGASLARKDVATKQEKQHTCSESITRWRSADCLLMTQFVQRASKTSTPWESWLRTCTTPSTAAERCTVEITSVRQCRAKAPIKTNRTPKNMIDCCLRFRRKDLNRRHSELVKKRKLTLTCTCSSWRPSSIWRMWRWRSCTSWRSWRWDLQPGLPGRRLCATSWTRLMTKMHKPGRYH